MKFAGKELRVAYDTLLHETITVGGSTIKCYDSKATTDAVKPYIIFGTYNQNSGGSKDSFEANSTINIEVIDGFNEVDDFDRSNVDYISNEILEKVRATRQTNGLTLTNFNCLAVNLQGTVETFLETGQENLFRNIIILEHILTEK